MAKYSAQMDFITNMNHDCCLLSILPFSKEAFINITLFLFTTLQWIGQKREIHCLLFYRLRSELEGKALCRDYSLWAIWVTGWDSGLILLRKEEDCVTRKDCTNIGWPVVQLGTQKVRFILEIFTWVTSKCIYKGKTR